jgi:hypothetical protein
MKQIDSLTKAYRQDACLAACRATRQSLLPPLETKEQTALVQQSTSSQPPQLYSLMVSSQLVGCNGDAFATIVGNQANTVSLDQNNSRDKSINLPCCTHCGNRLQPGSDGTQVRIKSQTLSRTQRRRVNKYMKNHANKSSTSNTGANNNLHRYYHDDTRTIKGGKNHLSITCGVCKSHFVAPGSQRELQTAKVKIPKIKQQKSAHTKKSPLKQQQPHTAANKAGPNKPSPPKTTSLGKRPREATKLDSSDFISLKPRPAKQPDMRMIGSDPKKKKRKNNELLNFLSSLNDR